MAGTRNTPQRQLIFSILKGSAHPLTAGEVYDEAVLRRPGLAKSTVYRNLEAMKERGELTHGLLQNGESYYSVAESGGHRHYMICKSCNRMVDLPECPLSRMEKEIARSSGFEVTEHALQLYGYCRDCRDKRPREEPHGSGEEKHAH